MKAVFILVVYLSYLLFFRMKVWSLAAAAASTRWPGNWRSPQGAGRLRGARQRRHRARPALENVPITDVRQLRDWALEEKIALTVVGPEAPLAAGVVDEFRAHGLRIFGPTRRRRSWKAPRPSPRPS
jgi:hypothetical protein